MYNEAWAAGFFDGEGSTFLRKQQLKSRTALYAAMTIGQQVDNNLDECPETLVRFHKTVQAGHLYGPCYYTSSRKGQWYWSARGRQDVEKVLSIIGLWLGTVKREQARRVLDNAEPYRTNNGSTFQLPEPHLG